MITLVKFDSADAAAQIACDEALFRLAESGRAGECVRIYESGSPAVVMGVGGRFRIEAFADRCQRDGVPLLRRISGGGTVILAPGSPAYSLILDMEARPELRSLRGSYQILLGRMADALAARGFPAARAGISDLALDGRKVAGCAQKRGRRYILFHGAILCGMEISLMERYLPMPPERPEYRAGRPHGDFVANLPLDHEGAAEAIMEAFAPQGAAPMDKNAAMELRSMAGRLVAEKYSSPAWNLRR